MSATTTTNTGTITVWGPGSRETLTLESGPNPHGGILLFLHGTYYVYCGMGGEHAVDIAIDWTVDSFDPEKTDVDEIAMEAIGWWLDENWSDPCEEGDDDA